MTPASAWTIDGYIKFDDVSSGSNSYVLGWNGTNGNDTTIGLTKLIVHLQFGDHLT